MSFDCLAIFAEAGKEVMNEANRLWPNYIPKLISSPFTGFALGTYPFPTLEYDDAPVQKQLKEFSRSFPDVVFICAHVESYNYWTKYSGCVIRNSKALASCDRDDDGLRKLVKYIGLELDKYQSFELFERGYFKREHRLP